MTIFNHLNTKHLHSLIFSFLRFIYYLYLFSRKNIATKTEGVKEPQSINLTHIKFCETWTLSAFATPALPVQAGCS